MCAVEGCERPKGLRRDWCDLHYDRWRRTRSTEPGRNSPFRTLDQRFWSRIERHASGCWLWTGHSNTKGYGATTREDGSRVYAHRLSFELHHGAVPSGMQVDHVCHVRLCVNPDHLRVVSPAENQANRGGASAISKTGVRGVYPLPNGRFVAQAKRKHVGTFETIAAAEAAVVQRRREVMPTSVMDHPGHPDTPCPTTECPCQRHTIPERTNP